MREIVVISGKGGTGKTSILASFSVLAGNAVIADCDVDAADMHLLLAPAIERRETFTSGHEAVIQTGTCTGCMKCMELCRFNAVRAVESGNGVQVCEIDLFSCEGCGVCVEFCPEKAIAFPESECGEWYVSATRAGSMVHAKLGIASENSGKLVTTVRKEAQKIAARQGIDMILVDGPPGIGCPVIASLTGATFVLVVTEPTLSGEHDLQRVLMLSRKFGIQSAVCINKWDLNPDMADHIGDVAASLDAAVAGRVRYDKNITKAQIEGKTAVEYRCEAGEDIKNLWKKLEEMERSTK